MQSDRIGADEVIDDTAGMTAEEIVEMQRDKEAKARATILEIVGDIPDADMAPPENVLFVCKLNPVTTDDDLEIIFSRFGKIIGYGVQQFFPIDICYIKFGVSNYFFSSFLSVAKSSEIGKPEIRCNMLLSSLPITKVAKRRILKWTMC